jgi:TolB protein
MMNRFICSVGCLSLTSLTACAGVIRPPIETTDAATRLEQVTHSATNELDPAVSPDASAIAYEVLAAPEAAPHVEIMCLKPHGGHSPGEVEFTTGETIGMEPTWMPYGEGLFFVTRNGRAPKLAEVLANGAGDKPWVASSDDVYFAGAWPAMSSRGKLAVSLADVGSYETGWPATKEFDPAVGVSDVPGTGVTILGRGAKPAWSPDGARLAFVRVTEGHAHLFVSNVDGSQAVQVTDGPADDESPAWSPDGTRIVFCSGPSTPSSPASLQANLFTINPDGSGLLQLTEGDRFACRPSWGRDGFIYFHVNATDRFHIWRIQPK